MEDKITIIEGPPPTFELVTESWVLGLNEGPQLSNMVLTRLRTFNGASLVERCHKAWRSEHPIYLEYRTSEGLEHQSPIVAARYVEVDDGQLLLLWLRMADDEVELELDYEDDSGEESDDDFEDPDIF